MGEYADQMLPSFARGLDEADTAPRNHGTWWTDTENQVLKNGVSKGIAWTELARRLRRTERACQLQAEKLNVRNPNQPAVAIKAKELNVNHMHLITLLQEDYTTCRVVFSDSGEPAYTYKMPKNSGIAIGDRVVVFGRDKLKVARVTEVHAEPQIDFSAPYALKWVVQKVDMAQYDEQVVKEAAALDHLTKVKRKKDQEKMLQDLFGGTEGLDELKKLLGKG